MNLFKNIFILLIPAFLLAGATGCNLAGLPLQSDWQFHPHVLDPHNHITAWQLLKERSDSSQVDTVFKRMMDAVQYAGMDSTDYLDTGRTFIFLHNDAVLRISKNKVTTDCYFGKYTVVQRKPNGDTVFDSHHKPVMGPAASWSDYPKQQVKNYLEYLIIRGEYSFDNLTGSNTEVQTLMPPGADSLNTNSVMDMLVTNDGNSTVNLNDFLGSAGHVVVRTAGILCTNGPVHVIDRVLFYQKQ